MDKYLLQILHEINTIIIPGLGALTVTNSKTGEIMFMGFLNHDDGNLAKYIAQKEGFSENDAKNLIAKYVREVNAKLDIGDTYDMYQFGSFKKINGEIEFENWNHYNQYETNSENMLTIEKSDNIDLKQEMGSVEDSQDKLISTDQALMEAAYSVNFESENKSLEEADHFIEDLISASQLMEKPKSLDEVLGNKEETEKKSIEKTSEAVEHQKKTKVIDIQTQVIEPEKPIKEKKKRSKTFWMAGFFLIFIAISASLIIIFYENIEEVLFAEEFDSYQIETPKDQNLKKDIENGENQVSLPDEKPLENEVKEQISNVPDINETTNSNKNPIENESTPITSNLPYHMICGAFGVKANAERQAKKFQNEGVNAIILGKFSGLYFVCYESFETKQEAFETLKNKSIKAWIFKYQR